MASVVGVIHPESAAFAVSERWRRSLSRSASRTCEAVRQTTRPPLLIAYRGDDRGFFQDGLRIVTLDGCVDNLRELVASTMAPDEAATVSDAGLIAELFARQGESVFERFTGSFALTLVTRGTGEVLLVRDRFGTRPLFYAETGAGWAWASEIKCLCPLLDGVTVDQEGLRQSIHYRFMIGETLIEGINQVLPACIVRLATGSRPVETLYWKLEFRPAQTDDGTEAWADRVDAGLDAHFARLRGRYRDVGILLSGGVDSALLALKAARSGFRSCIALTARWPGENPELEWATAVARHIGIEHQIVDVDDSYVEESYPWLVWRIEEPPRHYNSFILARLFEAASARVDMLLHGHAADALFGTAEFISIDSFSRRQAQLRFIPQPLRRALAAHLPADGSMRIARLKDYLQLDVHEFTKGLVKITYGNLGSRVFGRHFRSAAPSRRAVERFYAPLEAAPERFSRFDLYTFLQSHMAVLDRLSAPLGISVTMPFLSQEMVDIAVELPSRLKADNGTVKPVLKALAARSFPREWIYRSKQGFPTQTSRWLNGPLSRWTRTLYEERTASRGLLNPRPLRRAVAARDYEIIWTSMCLEMFCRQFVDGEGGPQSSRVPGS